MKKFLKNLLLAAAIWFIVMFLPLIVRTALWQGRAAEIFTLPAHTEVLCIGNSHTGCTWSDAPAFAFHKEWRSGRGFLFAVLRLLEFERRGQLGRAVLDERQLALARLFVLGQRHAGGADVECQEFFAHGGCLAAEITGSQVRSRWD